MHVCCVLLTFHCVCQTVTVALVCHWLSVELSQTTLIQGKLPAAVGMHAAKLWGWQNGHLHQPTKLLFCLTFFFFSIVERLWVYWKALDKSKVLLLSLSLLYVWTYEIGLSHKWFNNPDVLHVQLPLSLYWRSVNFSELLDCPSYWHNRDMLINNLTLCNESAHYKQYRCSYPPS